jgi:hypothetical protein
MVEAQAGLPRSHSGPARRSLPDGSGFAGIYQRRLESSHIEIPTDFSRPYITDLFVSAGQPSGGLGRIAPSRVLRTFADQRTPVYLEVGDQVAPLQISMTSFSNGG